MLKFAPFAKPIIPHFTFLLLLPFYPFLPILAISLFAQILPNMRVLMYPTIFWVPNPPPPNLEGKKIKLSKMQLGNSWVF